MSNEVFFTRDAEEVFHHLLSSPKKRDQSLLRAIERIEKNLKSDHRLGDPIRKQLFSKTYRSVVNLFRVPLPSFWRLLYTVRSKDNQMQIFILAILSHKECDKLFGYQR